MSLSSLFWIAVSLTVLLGIAQTFLIFRFRAQHPAIGSKDDLEAFKSVARAGMYLALGMLPVLIGGTILGMIAMAAGALGFLAFLVGMAIILGFGLFTGRFEEKAKTLPVTDPALEDEYRAVGESWKKKALPDF